jgi:hypothetical protein
MHWLEARVLTKELKDKVLKFIKPYLPKVYGEREGLWTRSKKRSV